MDNLNFLPADNYPVSSETLDFLQSMIKLVQKLTLLGGTTNYILEGCVKSGNNYSKGTVIINGEIFEVAAGVAQSSGGKDWVCLKETTVDALVYDTPYPNVQTLRTVEHGLGPVDVSWAISDFDQISTLQELLEAIHNVQGNLNSVESTLTNQLNALSNTVSGKAAASHTHAIANISGLQDALNGKSATGHGHSASEISGLPKGIVFATAISIGDCGGTDELKLITFPNGIVLPNLDYIVVGTLRSEFYGGEGDSNSRWNNDNDVIWMIRTKRHNGFSLALREVSTNTQNLAFDYAIIMI